jgi:hypothetical protein
MAVTAVGIVVAIGVEVGTDVVNCALQTGPAGIGDQGTLGMSSDWFGKMIYGHHTPFTCAIAHG